MECQCLFRRHHECAERKDTNCTSRSRSCRLHEGQNSEYEHREMTQSGQSSHCSFYLRGSSLTSDYFARKAQKQEMKANDNWRSDFFRRNNHRKPKALLSDQSLNKSWRVLYGSIFNVSGVTRVFCTHDVIRSGKRTAVLCARAHIDHEKKKTYDQRQKGKFRIRMLLKDIGGRGCRGGCRKQRWIFRKLAALPPSSGETETPRNTLLLRK